MTCLIFLKIADRRSAPRNPNCHGHARGGCVPGRGQRRRQWQKGGHPPAPFSGNFDFNPILQRCRRLSSFAAVPGREGWLVPSMAGRSTRSRQKLPLVCLRDVIVSAHSLAKFAPWLFCRVIPSRGQLLRPDTWVPPAQAAEFFRSMHINDEEVTPPDALLFRSFCGNRCVMETFRVSCSKVGGNATLLVGIWLG